MIFSHDELHIILRPRNVKIGGHTIVLIIEQICLMGHCSKTLIGILV